ncbi:SEL1-like repeat protein [Wohlfahrtiimonas larvae]|uniref:Sel1 repeat family protein n=1 Tax=Wohlfahrtiimonas larvae TaxID=1157986 RepID=A0ABP9MHB1_9GAMM|nr:SEL1-like repeat protein [Wohlfahrtiimonas larvae]
MRNSVIFVVAFIGLVAFFIYATNISNDSTANHMRMLNSTDSEVEKPKEVLVKSTVNQLSLDSILPNSDQLKDSEILEEAELLLASGNDQDIKNALSILNIMSERDNARADYLLAQLYEHGIKVSQDMGKSLALYKQSAMNGFEDANIYLFNYYLDHDDMNAEHLKNALEWFVQAADHGHNPIAEYALAHMYTKGLGVAKNIDQAIVHYQNAADQNFILAYEPLGDYYLQYGDNSKKITDAFLLFQRAANEDFASAQYKLGHMYERGMGVKQDYETARFWYDKARHNQFIQANVALGLLYENGLGVSKDNMKAYEYYRNAAEAGNVDAQNSVARAFERGLGVDQDLERAIFWYKEAAKQKDSYAEYNLGRIFEEYESVRNLDEAEAWYKEAANANISEAKQALNRLAK